MFLAKLISIQVENHTNATAVSIIFRVLSNANFVRATVLREIISMHQEPMPDIYAGKSEGENVVLGLNPNKS